MNISHLYHRHADQLEDFWGRRDNEPRFAREFRVFGQTIRLTSNHERVLTAVDHCQPLYSIASPVDREPFSIQIVMHAGPTDPGSVPDNLFDHIHYAGHADWLMLQLGRWGHAHVDLAAGHAVAVLSPQLAEQPDTVCTCLLNTVITNFFIAGGYGMLHASCLYRDGHALLLMAPHNTGKSTTALRLALAGYPLLSDSMIFLADHAGELRLLGFPVGRVKLREDVVPAFPHVHPLLSPEPVRDEVKHSFDLRDLNPDLVHEEAVSPATVDLCLLKRGDSAHTSLERATQTEVDEAVMRNSLFYDTAAVWERNLAVIEQLLDRASFYHLSIGSDGDHLVETVAQLWGQHA